MQAEAAISQLQELEPKLRARGISALYLFGSMARGENTERSDIDLAFDVVPGKRFSIFEQARMTRELSDALHAKVDLVFRSEIHPYIRAAIEGEQVKVFG